MVVVTATIRLSARSARSCDDGPAYQDHDRASRGTVAAVAAVISYRHAYELVSTHGETGVTARLVPFTVDGLILAASMLILDANRRNRPVPPLARWCLAAGILATIGANLAHGLGHGPIGALVSAWPALALAGSFELLMTLIRTETRASARRRLSAQMSHPLPSRSTAHHPR